MSSVVIDFLRELVFRNRERLANPVLDGPMRPNSKLDECPVLNDNLDEPDDIAFATNGAAYVTSGKRVVRFDSARFDAPATAAEFGAGVTCIAANPAGGIIAAVPGQGIAFIDGPDDGRLLALSGVAAARCPTAIVVGPSGDIYLCDGSQDNTADRWAFDLMQKRSSGRVLRIDPKTGKADILADGLRYPSGLCLARNGNSLIVSEAWSHNLLRIALNGGSAHASRVEAVMRNLSGYPGRLIALDSGYCLTVFALRTQLVDFVLTEDSYRQKMIERVDPAYWIVPTLRSEGHYLEPVQGGGLKKHGSLKAWAPPRSYGLAVFLDDEFEPDASLHSRVGGDCHGVTGVATFAGGVYLTSKGSGKIVLAAQEPVQ